MIDRPQELRPQRIFGNFRTKSPKKRISRQQRREGNCAKHLQLIRQLPCCVTGRVPAGEAHHLKSGSARNERGVGMRATDKWAVPLSRIPHDELERVGSRNEIAWFRANGIDDPHALAEALWNAQRDVEAMTRIILANRGGDRAP